MAAERFLRVLMPAAIAAKRANLRGRWQTLILGAGGALDSKATEVNVDDLGTLSTEAWEPAELAGERGWVVLREGALRPEGVFAGKRASSASASLLRPDDAVDAGVVNLAVPPPRGPNGTIYEALPRPALRRTRKGQPVGATLDLEASGHGPSYDVAWSGTHFVYPHTDRRGDATLTAIHCAP